VLAASTRGPVKQPKKMSQQIRTGKQPAPATPGPTTKCVYQIPHHADSGSKAQLEVFVTSEADVKKYLAGA